MEFRPYLSFLAGSNKRKSWTPAVELLRWEKLRVDENDEELEVGAGIPCEDATIIELRWSCRPLLEVLVFVEAVDKFERL